MLIESMKFSAEIQCYSISLAVSVRFGMGKIHRGGKVARRKEKLFWKVNRR